MTDVIPEGLAQVVSALSGMIADDILGGRDTVPGPGPAQRPDPAERPDRAERTVSAERLEPGLVQVARGVLAGGVDALVAAEVVFDRFEAFLVRARAVLAGQVDAVAAARAATGVTYPGDADPDLVFSLGVREEEQRLVWSDLSTVLRVSDRWVAGRYGQAQYLVGRYPGAVQAWADGVIRRGHVSVIERHGVGVPDEHVGEYEGLVVEAARTRTPVQLGRVAARVARRFTHPVAQAQERFHAALPEAGGVVCPGGGRDGGRVDPDGAGAGCGGVGAVGGRGPGPPGGG